MVRVIKDKFRNKPKDHIAHLKVEVDNLRKGGAVLIEKEFVSRKREANIRKAYLTIRKQIKDSESDFKRDEQRRNSRISELQSEIRDLGHALGGIKKEYEDKKRILDADWRGLVGQNTALENNITNNEESLTQLKTQSDEITYRRDLTSRELKDLIAQKEPFDQEVAIFNKAKTDFEEAQREFDLWRGQEESDLKVKKQDFNKRNANFAEQEARQRQKVIDNEKEKIALENLRIGLQEREKIVEGKANRVNMLIRKNRLDEKEIERRDSSFG